MRTLCVIPVRGGSRGIPRKNLAEIFAGTSLLQWTIGHAQAVYRDNEICVSTDDQEMLAVAETCGVNANLRPPELARDESTTASVVEHLVATLDQTHEAFTDIAILQVTSPLREVADVERGRDLMRSGKFDSVVSAYEEVSTHPAKMYFLDGDLAQPVLPELEGRRRQDLPAIYRRNGAIFMTRIEHFVETGRLWGGRTGLVIMPRERSIDVDEPADLVAAKRYFEQNNDKQAMPAKRVL